VALLIALALMGFMLFRYRPQVFWTVAPVAVVIGCIYIAAYWNSQGALGLPVRAIKSIVSSSAVDLRDQQSDQYRVLENINVLYTIKQAPLTGVGFGQKFDILVPMPDISFFEWWQYLSHNSVLYIWMKAGVLGFMALLFMVGWSIVVGADIVQRLPGGDMSAFALTATLYIVMHFVFAYVDISWDARSMLLIGTMLGMLSVIERLAARPRLSAARPVKRTLGLTLLTSRQGAARNA
jgi:O-antigen ligase